jgi:hypothetical protein
MAYAGATVTFTCLTFNKMCSEAFTYIPYHKTHFSQDNTAFTYPVSYGLKVLQYYLHDTAAFFGRLMAFIT